MYIIIIVGTTISLAGIAKQDDAVEADGVAERVQAVSDMAGK
jgi:hypothetical protein